VRLDHFRAFCAAWHVSPDAQTAEHGYWAPGPGADFFEAMQWDLGHLPFIAEDLGMITPDVVALRDKFELPGMRVLQFAFDGRADNPHLPANYSPNTIVYTGTHDNTTTRAWFESLLEGRRGMVRNHVGGPVLRPDEAAWELLRLAWSSRACLAIAPLQDVLNIGSEGRMNVPGTAQGNWRWRCTESMLTPATFARLRDLTSASGRAVTTSPKGSIQLPFRSPRT
jgi:4-alpha-glucanotransferase